MNYKHLGQNIRQERQKQNLSIEELSYKADITPNYLGKIERGETKLSLEVLIQIVNALDITLDDILFYELSSISHIKINQINNELNLLFKNKENYEFLNTIINFINKKETK